MAKKKFTGILDRFEGNKGVILSGDGEDTIIVPKHFLPDGSTEGDMISISIDKKDKRTADEKEKVRAIISKLSGK